jgi:hypothetical protein
MYKNLKRSQSSFGGIEVFIFDEVGFGIKNKTDNLYAGFPPLMKKYNKKCVAYPQLNFL